LPKQSALQSPPGFGSCHHAQGDGGNANIAACQLLDWLAIASGRGNV